MNNTVQLKFSVTHCHITNPNSQIIDNYHNPDVI